MSTDQAADPAYWPFVLYALSAIVLVAAAIALGHFLGPKRTGRGRTAPFESGIVPVGFARFRTSVQFYVVAMFFVIFDMETVFIFAWAVAAREAGWTGYVALVFFVVVLAVALAYEWAIGALDWAPQGRGRTTRAERPDRSQ
ncbi:MAG: NADH-quinone oxidoreductase subunit A [Thiohalorhabdus sp.]|uniref:NADH-quinone oxidoreductase subunit A n=1 Tax=Thiohalorhabdus sp. TaxID=3094134 RepID=UPI00397F1522